VSRVNVLDELELREVLFGEGEGKNYAVLCHPEDATYPISSVFQDANNDGSAPAEFKVLDCNHVLSSEKTIYERFKLKEKQRPTIFVSGKVGSPKQVSTSTRTSVAQRHEMQILDARCCTGTCIAICPISALPFLMISASLYINVPLSLLLSLLLLLSGPRETFEDRVHVGQGLEEFVDTQGRKD
jgi:hypothetical protein